MSLVVLTGTLATLAGCRDQPRHAWALRCRVTGSCLRVFGASMPRAGNPWVATVVMSAINILLLVLALATSRYRRALANVVSSLGLISILFYGLTGAAAVLARPADTAQLARGLRSSAACCLPTGRRYSWPGLRSRPSRSGAIDAAVLAYGLGSIALGRGRGARTTLRRRGLLLSARTSVPDGTSIPREQLRESKLQEPRSAPRAAPALYPQACELIPAGVNSTARARFSGWDPYPLFVDHGTGAHLF